MNIKKSFRLSGKEIRYISFTKRKKFLRWRILNINIIDQYSDKNYNKFGFSVSSKFHKRAVYRNIVRRIFFDIIYKNSYLSTKIQWKYKKIYVWLKKWVELDVKDKNFKTKIRNLMENDLKIIFK